MGVLQAGRTLQKRVRYMVISQIFSGLRQILSFGFNSLNSTLKDKGTSKSSLRSVNGRGIMVIYPYWEDNSLNYSGFSPTAATESSSILTSALLMSSTSGIFPESLSKTPKLLYLEVIFHHLLKFLPWNLRCEAFFSSTDMSFQF